MERKFLEVDGEKKTRIKPGKNLRTLSRDRRTIEKIYGWKDLGNALLMDWSQVWHVKGVGRLET